MKAAYRRHLAELGIESWRPRAHAEQAAARPSAGSPTELLAESAPQAAELAVRIAGADWDQLRRLLGVQDRRGASQPVLGVGAQDADLMVIGEAPGAEEDRLGEPFVGPAGQLLDAMLRSIAHDRCRNVYIANICKFRPPGNRDPRPEEVAADMPFLLRQIALVQPRLLLAVGRIAAQTLLESALPLGKLRGAPHHFSEAGVPLLVTYHPAYLLRSPREKSKSWQDLKLARAILAAS